MAMQFSFKYCIDPKDYKSEEEYKAIAVWVPFGQSSNTGCQGLADSALRAQTYNKILGGGPMLVGEKLGYVE